PSTESYTLSLHDALPISELDRSCLELPEFLPECCGVIVADQYDAEIVRPAPSRPLAAARRRAEVERLARTALRRQVVGLDPHCRSEEHTSELQSRENLVC